MKNRSATLLFLLLALFGYTAQPFANAMHNANHVAHNSVTNHDLLTPLPKAHNHDAHQQETHIKVGHQTNAAANSHHDHHTHTINHNQSPNLDSQQASQDLDQAKSCCDLDCDCDFGHCSSPALLNERLHSPAIISTQAISARPLLFSFVPSSHYRPPIIA